MQQIFTLISVYQKTGRFGRFCFCTVVDILWNYDMSNAWFQESSDWELRHDGACVSS